MYMYVYLYKYIYIHVNMHRKKYLVHRVHNKIHAVFLPCSPFPFCLCGPHPSLVCFFSSLCNLMWIWCFPQSGVRPKTTRHFTEEKPSLVYSIHITYTYIYQEIFFVLSIYLSNLIYPIYLSVYLSVYLSIYLSVCLSIPSIHPSIHPCIHLEYPTKAV